MRNYELLSKELYGTAPFGDEWTVGAPVSKSLLTAAFEFRNIREERPLRRLLAINIDESDNTNSAESVYSAIFNLQGVIPCIRSTIINSAPGRILLLDTLMPSENCERKLTFYETVKMGFDISLSLTSLQQKEIIHRNIKPRNIAMINGTWVLDGFEMAEFIRNTVSHRERIGTKMYMAPEAVFGRYDNTTDLYALAMAMYIQLNNGRPPFMGRYDELFDTALDKAISRRLSGEEIPPLMYADRTIDGIIRRALSPNPAMRYSRAAEMNSEINRYLTTVKKSSMMKCEKAMSIADSIMQDNLFSSMWDIGDCLGVGTYGTVYRARSKADNREYAVKVVRIPSDDEEMKKLSSLSTEQKMQYCSQAIARATSEALIYMQMHDCSRVLRMYDYGRVRTMNTAGAEFFWMQTELLSPIPARIADERAAAAIGVDVCEALAQIHSKGMTHRDIKPENILWAGQEGYKLSDFGVARMMRDKVEATVVGSRSYMAPEVLSGLIENKQKKAYNNSVDIFSLGMTLYTLLNNDREPFLPADPMPVTETDKAMAEQRRLKGEPLPLPAHCGPRLGAIIARACNADPTKRFRSADDMREALLNFLES